MGRGISESRTFSPARWSGRWRISLDRLSFCAEAAVGRGSRARACLWARRAVVNQGPGALLKSSQTYLVPSDTIGEARKQPCSHHIHAPVYRWFPRSAPTHTRSAKPFYHSDHLWILKTPNYPPNTPVAKSKHIFSTPKRTPAGLKPYLTDSTLL